MTDSLANRFTQYKNQHPKAHAYEIAKALGVSEMELLLLDKGATRLGNIPELFARLGELGEVLALTRNECVVHERTGTYGEMRHMGERGTVALFLGNEIDLRIFFRHIKHVYALPAVQSPQNPRANASLQFFDKDGTAVHKVFLRPQSSTEGFAKLCADFRAEDQDYQPKIKPVDVSDYNNPDSEIDVANLCREWDAMTDVHQFFPMLKKYRVDREQAVRLVGTERAYQVKPEAIDHMLAEVAAQQVPMMCFVGSHGVIQIFGGTIHNIKTVDNWLNIMDERFTLHLQHQGYARVWVVKKPSADGTITALECYSEDGTLRVQFFGKRETSQSENPKWRAILANLPQI